MIWPSQYTVVALRIQPTFTASKLTIETSRRSGVFIVNFEHIPHLVLEFLLLTLGM